MQESNVNDDSILENMMRTLGLTKGHTLYRENFLFRCKVCSFYGDLEEIELTCSEQQDADFDKEYYDDGYYHNYDDDWKTDKDDPTEVHGGKH